MSKDYTNVEDLLSESSYGEYPEEEEYVELFSYTSLFKSAFFMFILNIIISTISFFVIRPRFGKPISIGFNSILLTIIYMILSSFNVV